VRHVLVPVEEEPEVREGEGIIAAEEAVISSDSMEKEVEQCYSAEDTGDSVLQDRAI
jgi:hypothetical protein